MDYEKYYEILDLSPGANFSEVEVAYKKACTIYSNQNPEFINHFSNQEASEIKNYIDEAYKVLKAKLSPAPITSSHYQDRMPPAFYYNANVNFENEDFDTELKKIEVEIDPSLESELLKHSFYDGLILKKLRLKKKISLQIISQKTNIGLHHLKAIESNNFKSLPAAVFVKSYVKQYAEMLELNPQTVGDSYIRLYNESKQD